MKGAAAFVAMIMLIPVATGIIADGMTSAVGIAAIIDANNTVMVWFIS